MFQGHLDYFKKPLLGGRLNTKPGDHCTPYVHDRWFILFYCVWGHAWIKIHWNNIWLRARSHMTSHYTWGSITTLHDFEGVLGWSLHTFSFLRALAIQWLRLLAHVWSGPKVEFPCRLLTHQTLVWIMTNPLKCRGNMMGLGLYVPTNCSHLLKSKPTY